MDVQKTLAEIVVDYGAVRKFIAANPILSVIAAAIVGGLVIHGLLSIL